VVALVLEWTHPARCWSTWEVDDVVAFNDNDADAEEELEAAVDRQEVAVEVQGADVEGEEVQLEVEAVEDCGPRSN